MTNTIETEYQSVFLTISFFHQRKSTRNVQTFSYERLRVFKNLSASLVYHLTWPLKLDFLEHSQNANVSCTDKKPSKLLNRRL